MDIEVLMRASSDAELVCELYKQFDENSRLNRVYNDDPLYR